MYMYHGLCKKQIHSIISHFVWVLTIGLTVPMYLVTYLHLADKKALNQQIFFTILQNARL